MTISPVSLTFIWPLLLTASSPVTPGQNSNFTNVMTGRGVTQNMVTQGQLTTQEVLSPTSAGNITQSPEEKATKPSTTPSLQTTLTRSSGTFLPGIQTAAAPTSSTVLKINSSTIGLKSTTEEQFRVTTSAASSHASIPTTRVPSMLSGTTQSQFTSDKITHPSTHPMNSTNLVSTATASTKLVENKSTSTSHVTCCDATKSTGLDKTSAAMTKTPSSHITQAKKRQDPPENNANEGAEHGKVVAGLIGGALILMMVGFLVIYIKKKKLQRQKTITADWAGPSPFLEGGVDNGQVTLRSSNRISLASFLPQSLTKRLSSLPEKDEELKDMTPGTTFGDKHHESTSGQEVDGDNAKENTGTAVDVPEIKTTADAPETVENHLSQ